MDITYIGIMIVLVVFSGFFSATETAFSSLNRTKIKALAEKKNKRAKLVLNLADSYDKLISTILIGNNIVNIGLATVGTIFFVKLLGDAGASVSTVVITIVVLIFGEISPKSIAKDLPEDFAMATAPLINIFIYILYPLNYLFGLWKKLLDKIFDVKRDKSFSQEELLVLVDEVQSVGSIDRHEGELLRNAISFTDTEAESILTPRVDLVAASVYDEKDHIARLFTESKFSRILIYEGSIDNIIGVIHQKDFYIGSGISSKSNREILSPVVYALKEEKIGNLLRQLQKEKSQVVIVLDEYGGTYGLVTMEDILEELVGEIWDEHDEITEDYREVALGVYRVTGTADLEDFFNFFNIKDETEMASLSGWVSEKIGHIAKVGNYFHFNNLRIKVKKMDNHRITEIEVKILQERGNN